MMGKFFTPEKRHAIRPKYLMAITASLFVFAGILWFKDKNIEDAFNHSYHGSYLTSNGQYQIMAALSFDAEPRLAYLKMVIEDLHSPDGKNNLETCYIEMKSDPLKHQTMIKAKITLLHNIDNNAVTEEWRLIPISMHYDNGLMSLIIDSTGFLYCGDKLKDNKDKLIFILVQDK